MKVCEFLLQKEGDRTWLPLESPTVEILEGRYRIVARTPYADADLEVEVSYWSPDDVPPKRRMRHWNRRTNHQGLMPLLPFSTLRPGNWQIQCSSDLMTDMADQGWQHRIELLVLAREEFPEDDLVEHSYGQTDRLDQATAIVDIPASSLPNLPEENRDTIAPEPLHDAVPPNVIPSLAEASPARDSTRPNPIPMSPAAQILASLGEALLQMSSEDPNPDQAELRDLTLSTQALDVTLAQAVDHDQVDSESRFEDSDDADPRETVQGEGIQSDIPTKSQLRDLAEQMSQLVVDTVLEVAHTSPQGSSTQSPGLQDETEDFFRLDQPNPLDTLATESLTPEGLRTEALTPPVFPRPETIAPRPNPPAPDPSSFPAPPTTLASDPDLSVPPELLNLQVALTQTTLMPNHHDRVVLEGQILQADGSPLQASPRSLLLRVLLQNPNNMETRLAESEFLPEDSQDFAIALSFRVPLDWTSHLLLGEVQLQMDDLYWLDHPTAPKIPPLAVQGFTITPSVNALLNQLDPSVSDMEWNQEELEPEPPAPQAPNDVPPIPKPTIKAEFLEVSRRAASLSNTTPDPNAVVPEPSPSDVSNPSKPSLPPQLTPISPAGGRSSPDLPQFLKPRVSQAPVSPISPGDSPVTQAIVESQDPPAPRTPPLDALTQNPDQPQTLEQLSLLDLQDWTEKTTPTSHVISPSRSLELPPIAGLNPSRTTPSPYPEADSFPPPTAERDVSLPETPQEPSLDLAPELLGDRLLEDWFDDPSPQTLETLESLTTVVPPETLASLEDLAPPEPDVDPPLTDWFGDAISDHPTEVLPPLEPANSPPVSITPEDSPPPTLAPPILGERFPLDLEPLLPSPRSSITPEAPPLPTPADPSPPGALGDDALPPHLDLSLDNPLTLSDPEPSPSEELLTPIPSRLERGDLAVPVTDRMLNDLTLADPSEDVATPIPDAPLSRPADMGAFFEDGGLFPVSTSEQSPEDPLLDSFFSEPSSPSQSRSWDLDGDPLEPDLSNPNPWPTGSGDMDLLQASQPFVADHLREEVVVMDEWLDPHKRYWMSTLTPAPVPTFPEDQAIPVPELMVPEGDWVANVPLSLTVRIPATPSRLLVKVWLIDCQTRSLAREPYWVNQFLPTLPDFLEAIVEVQIPPSCLQVQLEALTLEPATQRESHKVSLIRLVVPPDLPPLETIAAPWSASSLTPDLDPSDSMDDLEPQSLEDLGLDPSLDLNNALTDSLEDNPEDQS